MANIALQSVDFVSADGKPTAGLVPVHKETTLNIDEKAAVIDAALLDRIDFVYFRRLSDGRSSQVAAYVVDNSNENLDNKSLAELHRQVWLQGKTPLLYVSWLDRVDILACARGPDFWNERFGDYQYNPTKTLKTAGEISSEMQNFSAFRLADGTFWEDPHNAELANYDKAAHQSLIQAVVETDKNLDGKRNPVLRRLLLLMVLVKYLEDRRVFPNGWFGRFHKGAKSFFEVLKGSDTDEVNRLLIFLENKFNGDVFDISCLDWKRLTKTALTRFANLVESRTLKRQRYLWDQFSFEHLPVEIISHLYQRFVEDGHGAVYTPPFLAALLLDHAMPYPKLTGNERVLDPACGSAVFLVGAFRRLVNFWRSKNDWQKPTVETLKKILKNSIYGIDLDSSAIDLSAFSLSLAICDALKPDVIWKELKFDRLRDANLFEKDFFQLLLDSKRGTSSIFDKHFDVVIGNPPFESKLTPAGQEVNRWAEQQENNRKSLPDKQAAYLFLEQGLSVLHPNDGRICLIQPSGFLYNHNVNTFRTKIFQKCQVNTIFDFTSIRNLYEADTKTISILAYNVKTTKDHGVKHWTFRRTVSTHQRICFELDHYDRHRVSQEQAETDSYVWRANLLGGGRLFEISKHLRSMRTLVKYLKEKKWDYGEGFIVAKTGRRPPALFLKGKSMLPTKAFTDSGIDESQIEIINETHFRSAYTEDRYKAPLILIKEVESLPIAFREKGFLAYRNEIVGIHAPASDEKDLRKLYDFIRHVHDIYRFAVTLHGSRSFVSRSTAIFKRDIDQLPFPEQSQSLDTSFWENSIQYDVLKYMIDYIRLGQNSELLRKKASVTDIEKYSNMFCRMLGSVYDNLHASNPIFLDGLTCQPFYFGDHPNISWITQNNENDLKKLVYYDNHDSLRTVRIVRVCIDNVLLIIKPDRLRYWIPSTAIRDADETLVYLHQEGY